MQGFATHETNNSSPPISQAASQQVNQQSPCNATLISRAVSEPRSRVQPIRFDEIVVVEASIPYPHINLFFCISDLRKSPSQSCFSSDGTEYHLQFAFLPYLAEQSDSLCYSTSYRVFRSKNTANAVEVTVSKNLKSPPFDMNDTLITNAVHISMSFHFESQCVTHHTSQNCFTSQGGPGRGIA